MLDIKNIISKRPKRLFFRNIKIITDKKRKNEVYIMTFLYSALSAITPENEPKTTQGIAEDIKTKEIEALEAVSSYICNTTMKLTIL